MNWIAAFLAAAAMAATPERKVDADSGRTIRDSYSIGEGATEKQSWPVFAGAATKSGFPVEVVSNPSRTGWTTQDAIEHELAPFRAAKPVFGTLMVGVNDWVQGVNEETFRTRLAQIMDAILRRCLTRSDCS